MMPYFRLTQAWLVHFLTSLGAVIALWTCLAIAWQQWILALGLMLLAMIVDGIDGPLARLFRVKDRLPHFSGEVLDLVIDFSSYAIIPAFFVANSQMLDEKWRFSAAALMVLASCYWYGNSDQKTDDNCFKRFPCLWNAVVAYLFVLQASPLVSLWVILLFVILSFVPIHFIHPTRAQQSLPNALLRKSFVILTVLVFAASLVALVIYPVQNPLVVAYTVGFWSLYLLLSLYKTFKALQ